MYIKATWEFFARTFVDASVTREGKKTKHFWDVMQDVVAGFNRYVPVSQVRWPMQGDYPPQQFLNFDYEVSFEGDLSWVEMQMLG